MKECPIGLICKQFDCRPQICHDYAAPIDLPYEIWSSDGYYPKGALVCQLPEFEEYPDCEESDWVLYNRAEHNFRIDRIRIEMEAEGWGGLCELPYFYDLENCCLFVDTDYSRTYGFARAIPFALHFRPSAQEMERDLEPDGFCGTLLLWDEYYEFDM